MVPNFASGYEINTDELLKMSGQGAVYVRLLEPYTMPESETDFDCEDRLIQTILNFGKRN